MADETDTKCPICGSKAKPLGKTGDATGFDCPIHSRFKVAGSIFAIQSAYTSEQWEAALKRAKSRTPPGVWPTIMTNNF